MATATVEHNSSSATSSTNVGNLFTFSYPERALITLMLDEYDKKAKGTWKNLAELALSLMQVETARSRVAIVKDALDKSDEDDTITMTEPMRTVLGDACSLHARKLAKRKDQLQTELVETNDVEDALEAVQRIANRIGPQLVLFVETPDDEE